MKPTGTFSIIILIAGSLIWSCGKPKVDEKTRLNIHQSSEVSGFELVIPDGWVEHQGSHNDSLVLRISESDEET